MESVGTYTRLNGGKHPVISIDFSKPAPRFFVYLLSLFPGLFFLLSVAVGKPELARAVIKELVGLYPVPSYGLLVLLLGSGFVIGQAFVIASGIFGSFFSALYRAVRAALRRTFGGQGAQKWLMRLQGMPPKQTLASRALSKAIYYAHADGIDSPDAKSVRFCLAAATEALLLRKYGIDQSRATGPNGSEWQVWFSAVGARVKSATENVNVAKTVLATGNAGFIAALIAQGLRQRYFIGMCSVFAFAGLYTAAYYFFELDRPIRHDMLRLRSVLTELHEYSRMSAPANGRLPSDGEAEE